MPSRTCRSSCTTVLTEKKGVWLPWASPLKTGRPLGGAAYLACDVSDL